MKKPVLMYLALSATIACIVCILIVVMPSAIEKFITKEQKIEDNKLYIIHDDNNNVSNDILCNDSRNKNIQSQNGRVSVQIERIDNSIKMNDKILANIYYDLPVLKGDSKSVDIINKFFYKESEEWFNSTENRLNSYQIKCNQFIKYH